ncbi:MAG: ABC transporter ATP-binding protein [Synergistaceae bacterium]|jgi:branched-chain amino acid transport system ATP-binding protein|nr:ABC transporter ATP-binding protein [Synergistaceae bacterium]
MLLQVEHLRIRYGHVEVLHDVSFGVDTKEIVTIIGSNGAGKSSMLMGISNLVDKAGGRVVFKGTDITSSPPAQVVAAGIGHIPEGRLIFPWLTVEENLLIGDSGNPKSHRDKSVTQKNMDLVYRLFPKLKERRAQNGGTLSGGEQQMLAIGRGLMLDPDLIMFDEPSLGLAPVIVEDIFEHILAIRDMGKTILLIEQNASMALQLADRAYVMETGTITHTGNAKDLLNDPKVINAYLGI